MNEYERILRKAVAELGESDESARYAVYERARTMVLRQLRAFDPPKTDEEIDQHLAALDASVQHIESEHVRAAPAPVRPRVIEEQAAPFEPPPQKGRMSLAIIGIVAAVLVAAAGAYVFATRPPAQKPIAQIEPKANTAATKAAPSPAKNAPAKTRNEPPAPTLAAGPEGAVAAGDPQGSSFVLRRQRVFYRTTYPVGSIVVSRSQRFLYVVQPNQVAIRYAIGVGPGCENVAGLFHVTQKQQAAAQGQSATFEPPALYFDAARAVHRTVEPASIGEAAKAGCFGAWDSDIADLYQRVQLNDRVIVAN